MIQISVIVQRKHHLQKRRTRIHKIIKYHPIRIKDAENVPDVGKEHNATVQRALTPVTDKVLCTLSSIIQEKSIKKIIHTYTFLHTCNFNTNYIYINNFRKFIIKK
jgi:hypothetical protein